MDARKLKTRIEHCANALLVILLLFGLWQAYGAWLLGGGAAYGD
jgi:hypothetical protein